ncbi:MAG: hypothetical protein LIO49_03365, partial [Ruminococcus sp.]|nr:hypothetical protein [Ruminococcus sp.]
YALDETILGYADVDYTEEVEDEEVVIDDEEPEILDAEELDVSAEDLATLEFVGTDYVITVSYGEDAALPEGTELVAYEYAQDSENFLARYEEAAELYGWEDSDETDPYHGFRLFNIGLYYDGAEIEPAAAVTVTVTYTGEDVDMDSVYVTHFTDTSTEPLPTTVETTEDTQSVTFTSDSFSEFGIMMASEEEGGIATVAEEGTGLYVTVDVLVEVNVADVISSLNGSSFIITGNQRTRAMQAKESSSTMASVEVDGTDISELTQWTFTSGSNGGYYISSGGSYLKMGYSDADNGTLSLVDSTADATEFTVYAYKYTDGVPYLVITATVNGCTYYINKRGGDSSSAGFVAYSSSRRQQGIIADF